jgi:DNA 3'-phosphatase
MHATLRLVCLASCLAAVWVSGCGAGEEPGAQEADLKSCTGAKLDAKGVCRKEGAFAAAKCCKPQAPVKRRDLTAYSCPAEGDAIKVAFLDADSTLRVSKSGSVSANGADDVNVLPFVAAGVARLQAEGYLTAIVSNQGGIEQGHITYEIAEGALAFTASQLGALGGRIDYFDFAEAKGKDRKPEVGMALRLDELLQEKCGRPLDVEASIMVGDSGYKKGVDGPHPDGRPADDFSNADRGFAENLGVPFHEPTDFFGWKQPWEVFNIATEDELVRFLEAIEEEAARLEESGEDEELAESLAKEARDNRKVNGL